MCYHNIQYNLNPGLNETARKAAIGYINYIHGVNPLRFVYLSNMFRYGADQGVREFYHTWFANGSSKWDRVGVSQYGPAPGFLTGGANPSYDWDGCCPGNCGSSNNNALCTSMSITPPKGQPNQKSYKDFNTSWPLNSWSVTENSNGYQISYIRLLSKFVQPEYDCNGDLNGTAVVDACGNCSGGNTGMTPVNDPDLCAPLVLDVPEKAIEPDFRFFPNPASDMVTLSSCIPGEFSLELYGSDGRLFLNQTASGSCTFSVSSFPEGVYCVVIKHRQGGYSGKLLKMK